MPTVVVVDDDHSSAHLIKMLLELEGFAVKLCISTAEAIRATDAHVSAFVIDYYLADNQNGLVLVQAIRGGQTNAKTQTPIIIVSGDIRRERETVAAGANLFLQKPYSPYALSNHLRTLIAKENQHG